MPLHRNFVDDSLAAQPVFSSRWRINVVLPAPKKSPVTTVTGRSPLVVAGVISRPLACNGSFQAGRVDAGRVAKDRKQLVMGCVPVRAGIEGDKRWLIPIPREPRAEI